MIITQTPAYRGAVTGDSYSAGSLYVFAIRAKCPAGPWLKAVNRSSGWLNVRTE